LTCFSQRRRFTGYASVEIETQGTATKTTEVIADRIHDICRATGYFGEFFRRMRAKLGTAQAITATAHKIARILYHVLSPKEPYTETIFHLYDEQAHHRAEIRLRKQAAHLGFQLQPISATGE
jgi:transposase